MDWLKGRAKEPSSYLAVAVGGVGLGVVLSIPIVVWAGVVCAILGIVLKEQQSSE